MKSKVKNYNGILISLHLLKKQLFFASIYIFLSLNKIVKCYNDS